MIQVLVDFLPLVGDFSQEEIVELKQILQEMGSTLVDRYGFKRANLVGNNHLDNSTTPIVEFLLWLESTPEAKQVLADMGYAPKLPSTAKVFRNTA